MRYELKTPHPFLTLPLTSERSIRRLRQLLVGSQFLKTGFERRFDHRKSVAAGDELSWRIIHPGDFYQNVTELGGIILLRMLRAACALFGPDRPRRGCRFWSAKPT